ENRDPFLVARHLPLTTPFRCHQCQAKLLWLTSHKITRAATKSRRLRERVTALSITDLPRSHRVTSASPAPLPQENNASGPSIDKSWNGRMTSTKRRIPKTASARAAIANQLANFIVGLQSNRSFVNKPAGNPRRETFPPNAS